MGSCVSVVSSPLKADDKTTTPNRIHRTQSAWRSDEQITLLKNRCMTGAISHADIDAPDQQHVTKSGSCISSAPGRKEHMFTRRRAFRDRGMQDSGLASVIENCTVAQRRHSAFGLVMAERTSMIQHNNPLVKKKDALKDYSEHDEMWQLIKSIDPYTVEDTIEQWIEAKRLDADLDGVSFNYFIHKWACGRRERLEEEGTGTACASLQRHAASAPDRYRHASILTQYLSKPKKIVIQTRFSEDDFDCESGFSLSN